MTMQLIARESVSDPRSLRLVNHKSRAAMTRTVALSSALILLIFCCSPFSQNLNASDDEKIREENGRKYSDGATVPTDPELEELLRRAQLFADDGSFRNATVLWSKVLEKGSGALVTQDGETYRALTSVVEEGIAQLPPEGLQAYRIIADGDAQALLAEADKIGQANALRKVVDRYFMSSLGDQAAYDLAAIALDQYDLVTARRLMERIINRHPDPDVDLGMLFVRLSVAYSGLQQSKLAQQAFRTALKADPPVDPVLLDQVSRFMAGAGNQSSATLDVTSSAWAMPWGNSRRTGAMPSLPADYMSSDLTIAAQSALDLSIIKKQFVNPYQQGVTSGGSTSAQGDLDKLHELWMKRSWQPAQSALVTPEGVIVKTARYPSCLQWSDSGQLAVQWQSLWYNSYRIDDHTIAQFLNQQMYGGGSVQTGGPTSPDQVFLFGDRIHQSMAVIGDVVYVVEGQPYPKQTNKPPQVGNTGRNQQAFWGPQALRRSRTNWMTAYRRSSGKLLWNRMAEDDDDELAAKDDADAGVRDPFSRKAITNGVGFMGPPVGAGELILAPVTNGGSIWIYALSASTGETRWKTQLCDEPSNGAPAWSTIYLAVDGQDCYATCGVGVVFAVDVADGRMRFARRYERSTSGRKQPNNNFGNQMPVNTRFNGWDDDLVVPYQGVIVVLASDSDRIMAFDRTSGQFAWDGPRRPFGNAMTYCLGVRDRYLFAAGSQSMLCYDLAGQGRLVWRDEFSNPSYARGCLTQDGIYMPIKDSIAHYRFDEATPGKPKKMTQVGVKGLGDSPVGNLISDGTRLWSIQPGRVLALAGTSDQLDRLNRKIENGDLEARWRRAQLAFSQPDSSLWQDDWRVLTENQNKLSEATLKEIQSLSWLKSVVATDDPSMGGCEFLLELARLDQSNPGWIDWDNARSLRKQIRKVIAARCDPSATEELSTWNYIATSLGDHLWLAHWLQQSLPPADRQKIAAEFIAADDIMSQHVGVMLLPSPCPEDLVPRLEQLALATQNDPANEPLKLATTLQLLRAQRTAGVDSAIELMSSGDPLRRQTAFVAAARATGRDWVFDALADDDERKSSVARISAQWQVSKQQVSWRTLPETLPVSFGRIIAGFPSSGEVVEFDTDGKVLRASKHEGVLACLGRTNGDRWVATPSQLTKIGPDDEAYFSIELERYPESLSPLPNGSVLVCFGEFPGMIQSVDSTGNVEWQRDLAGHGLAAACQLNSDITLISSVLTGQLLKVDTEGTVVGDLPLLNVSSLTPLPEGRLLVTSSLNGEVLELNNQQRTVFKRRGLPQARGAVRLENGNTVVACSRGLVAIDRDGNEVWKFEDKGAAITVSSY